MSFPNIISHMLDDLCLAARQQMNKCLWHDSLMSISLIGGYVAQKCMGLFSSILLSHTIYMVSFLPLGRGVVVGTVQVDWLWFQFLYKDFCFILAYPNSCTRLVGILVWAKHYTNIIDFSCYEFCARNRFRGFLKCRFSTCIVMHSHHRYHFFNCLC